MSSKRRPSAVNATAPTSRATFRGLARNIGATNREADSLRHALLAQWAERGGIDDLTARLEVLQPDEDHDGSLAAWFAYDADEEPSAPESHPVLSELSGDLQERLRELLQGPTSPDVNACG